VRVVRIDRVDHECSYGEVRDARKLLGTIWVVPDAKDVTALTGDDWDDAPEHCNAGYPYGAQPIDIYYGDNWEKLRRALLSHLMRVSPPGLGGD